MNRSISYTDIRNNLKTAFDEVCSQHVPLLVKRKRGENVVVISAEDFSSLEETAYLLQSPKNASRLLEALVRQGKRKAFRNVTMLKNAIGA